MRLRLMSMVGADHTAAPAGPYIWVPAMLRLVGAGVVGMVGDFHFSVPVLTLIATTQPRALQHS